MPESFRYFAEYTNQRTLHKKTTHSVAHFGKETHVTGWSLSTFGGEKKMLSSTSFLTEIISLTIALTIAFIIYDAYFDCNSFKEKDKIL